jgi:hypothetical protein
MFSKIVKKIKKYFLKIEKLINDKNFPQISVYK